MSRLPTELWIKIIETALWYPELPCEIDQPIMSILLLRGARVISHTQFERIKLMPSFRAVSCQWRAITDEFVARRHHTVSAQYYDTRHIGSTLVTVKWEDDNDSADHIPASTIYCRIQNLGDEPLVILDLPALTMLSMDLRWTSDHLLPCTYTGWSLPSLQILDIHYDSAHPEDMRNMFEAMGSTITTLSIMETKRISRRYIYELHDRDMVPVPEQIWRWCPLLRTLRVSIWQFCLLQPPPIGFPSLQIYLSDFDSPWTYHDVNPLNAEPWDIHLAKWADRVTAYRLGLGWEEYYRYSWNTAHLLEFLLAVERAGGSVCDASQVAWNNEAVQRIYHVKEAEYLSYDD